MTEMSIPLISAVLFFPPTCSQINIPSKYLSPCSRLANKMRKATSLPSLQAAVPLGWWISGWASPQLPSVSFRLAISVWTALCLWSSPFDLLPSNTCNFFYYCLAVWYHTLVLSSLEGAPGSCDAALQHSPHWGLFWLSWFNPSCSRNITMRAACSLPSSCP